MVQPSPRQIWLESIGGDQPPVSQSFWSQLIILSNYLCVTFVYSNHACGHFTMLYTRVIISIRRITPLNSQGYSNCMTTLLSTRKKRSAATGMPDKMQMNSNASSPCSSISRMQEGLPLAGNHALPLFVTHLGWERWLQEGMAQVAERGAVWEGLHNNLT